MTERRYRMLRLSTGDYLLPSNDARTTWRLKRYYEHGDAIITDRGGRERPLVGAFWEAYRFAGHSAQAMAESIEDEDWSLWECWGSTMRTRREAIDFALSREEGNR